MTETELYRFWLIVKLTPAFFILGIGLTVFFKHWSGEDVSLFMSSDEAMAPYSTFGGYGPALLAAIWGIVVGIVIETAAIALVYEVTVVSPHFGVLDYYFTSTLAVMFGAAFAYWQYLEMQTTIRESLIYRGWV